MGLFSKFINTDVSPGGDGSIGNPYATLAEGLTPFHLTTLSDAYDFFAIGLTPDTGNLDHTPWEFTTSPTNKVRVFGNNTLGKWNDNAYRISAVNQSGIYNQYAAHVELYNLQVQVKITDGGNHNGMRLATANNIVTGGPGFFIYGNCIVRKDPTSTNGFLTCWIDSVLGPGAGSGELYRWNCLAIGLGGTSAQGFNTDGSAWAQAHCRTYNATSAKMLYGYQSNAITTNSIAADCGFGFIGSEFSGDYNASEEDYPDIPGANSDKLVTFSFVDRANGDYHLLSTDEGARGQAIADPSGGLFLDDIDGETRTGAWDRGCDQYVAVAAGQPMGGRHRQVPHVHRGGSLVSRGGGRIFGRSRSGLWVPNHLKAA